MCVGVCACKGGGRSYHTGSFMGVTGGDESSSSEFLLQLPSRRKAHTSAAHSSSPSCPTRPRRRSTPSRALRAATSTSPSPAWT